MTTPPRFLSTIFKCDVGWGGRIAVIDYKLWSELPGAPPPERRLSRESLDEAMAASGLLLAKGHEFLPEQFFVEYVLP